MLTWGRRLQRFGKLPSSERNLVVRALVLHLGIRLQLWRRGLDVSQAIGPNDRLGQAYVDDNLPPDRIARLVSVAIREGPVRGNCLSESVTLCRLLRRSGHECTLRIGARRRAGEVEAHAWVEIHSVPLNDRADIAELFTPFPVSSEPILRWVV